MSRLQETLIALLTLALLFAIFTLLQGSGPSEKAPKDPIATQLHKQADALRQLASRLQQAAPPARPETHATQGANP